jgi:uncharacterized protein
VAVYFLDTSTVVKRYVQETGTAWVQALTAPAAGHSPCLVRITLAEVVAAVTRRERGGHLSAQAAATALADFQYDFGHQYLIIEVSAALVDRAAALARKHALRGYDAVRLAAALEVHSEAPPLTLLSADVDLNAAASAEGLLVDDPNNHRPPLRQKSRFSRPASSRNITLAHCIREKRRRGLERDDVSSIPYPCGACGRIARLRPPVV